MFKNVPGPVVCAALVVSALFNCACGSGSLPPGPGPTPPAGGSTPLAAPVVQSVVPARAAATIPTRVTIRGERFDAGATVTIGGTRADVLQAATTSIDVMTPTHSAGIVDVLVTNPDGLSGRLAAGFTFESVPATIPVVESMSPLRGVTTGGTSVEIRGTGFDAQTSVSIDGIAVRTFFTSSGDLNFTTFAHDPGPVDITVTNAAGVATRPGGFTYAPPDAFNFNGTWTGLADGPPDSLVEMSFTIANDVLVSISCGSLALTPAPEFKVRDGAFSFQGENGIRLSARILSDVAAAGEIAFGPCNPSWVAKKK